MTSRRDDDPPPDLTEFVRLHGDWRRMPAEQWATYTSEQQDLMRRSGVYSLVTAEEWCEWDRLNAEWQERRRRIRPPADSPVDELLNQLPKPEPIPFERCATCGQEAQFGYRDAESGEFVWFCAEHRRAQWWADARRDPEAF
jgi:hypothetical protein